MTNKEAMVVALLPSVSYELPTGEHALEIKRARTRAVDAKLRHDTAELEFKRKHDPKVRVVLNNLWIEWRKCEQDSKLIARGQVRLRDVVRDPRERGYASIVMCFMLLMLLLAFAATQGLIAAKNSKSSRYFGTLSECHEVAESATALALHEVQYLKSDGNLGSFTTPLVMGIISYYTTTEESGGLLTIRATAFKDDATAQLETIARVIDLSLPKVGAIYVGPSGIVDTNGKSLNIDGNDLDKKEAKKYGISNPDPASEIITTLPSSVYGKIKGLGPTLPSVGQITPVDIDKLFNLLQRVGVQNFDPQGAVTKGVFGTISDPNLTYVRGDLHISGQQTGAGVLLIDGSLKISGQFTYYGVIIVRGDVDVTGGGAQVHTYGTLFDTGVLTISGTADLLYSSSAVDRVQNLINGTAKLYERVYYNEN